MTGKLEKKFTKRLVGFFLAHELAHNKDTRKKIKRILKESGQKPMPSSSEIFPNTPKVVAILIAAGCVGISENRNKILKKDQQLELI